MADHYVRHKLSAGDTVSTEFECRAPEDGRCRSVCRTCGSFAHSCQCRPQFIPSEVPDIRTGEPCGLLPFLEEESEYSYGGDDTEVRGPGWQPIQLDWMPNDEGYEWTYADD